MTSNRRPPGRAPADRYADDLIYNEGSPTRSPDFYKRREDRERRGATEQIQRGSERAAQDFERRLIENYERSQGKQLRPAQRAVILDMIDKAAIVPRGERSASQAAIMRVTKYQEEIRDLTQTLGANPQQIVRMISERMRQEPLERIASWSPEAARDWSPQDAVNDQGEPVSPARGRQMRIPREQRQELDRRAAERAGQYVDPETGNTDPYTRTAPEYREREARPAQATVDWTRTEPTLGRTAMTGADELLAQVHDPTIDTGDMRAGMRAEIEARPDVFREQGRAAYKGLMTEPGIQEFISRRFGRTYDALTPGQKSDLHRMPAFQDLLQAENARGPKLANDRLQNFPLPMNPDADYETRGDLVGPQRDRFFDAANMPGTPPSIDQSNARSSRSWAGTLDIIQQTIERAIQSGDTAGALRGLGQYAAMEDELANMPDTEDEFFGSVTNQSRFRTPESSGESMSRPAQPLSLADQIFGRMMEGVDDDVGLKRQYIDRTIDAAGNPGNPIVPTRRSEIGSWQQPDDPAWDINDPTARPAISDRIPQRPGSTDIRDFAPDFRMPLDPNDLSLPPKYPNLPPESTDPRARMRAFPEDDTRMPALPDPMISRTHFDPSQPPTPGPSQPAVDPAAAPTLSPRWGAPHGIGSSLDPGPRPGPAGTFDSILQNITKHRPTGNFIGGLGKSLDAFGLAGDVLDSGEMSQFFDYLKTQGMDQDPAALTLGTLGSVPLLGPLIFDRQKFMHDPAYQNSFRAPLAIS